MTKCRLRNAAETYLPFFLTQRMWKSSSLEQIICSAAGSWSKKVNLNHSPWFLSLYQCGFFIFIHDKCSNGVRRDNIALNPRVKLAQVCQTQRDKSCTIVLQLFFCHLLLPGFTRCVQHVRSLKKRPLRTCGGNHWFFYWGIGRLRFLACVARPLTSKV